ncbi:hypothetical protein PINS_up021322 [Pythium insidiosum]|nr:hypothetical protein PINS_up021322 [Pythium insidiosum]
MARQALLSLLLLALVACNVCSAASQNETYHVSRPIKVADKIETNLVFARGAEHSEIITSPKASFIAVHFADFSLNNGDLVIVRSPDATTAFTYDAEGVRRQSSFVADLVPGESAVIEYFPSVTTTTSGAGDRAGSGVAFRINAYSRGIAGTAKQEALCDNDDMVQAKCFAPGSLFYDLRPLAYERGLAVARLLIGGSSVCTGWLIGSAGHLMTNAHCVADEAMASTIHVEFGAEAATCLQKCDEWLACKGTTVALSTTLVARNSSHDYALLKLPDDVDLRPWGYLQLRKEGVLLGESIYVPNHALAWGKRLAVMNGGQMITADFFHPRGHCGQNAILFSGDIQKGASGSPAIAASDNKVVGLVTCGGTCEPEDAAEDITLIIADLERQGIHIPDAY